MLLILVFGSCSVKESKLEKPNVIFILTDQWRASALGYAGDPNVRTPRLDELAASSVNFVNAVSVCPVCTPYRASLLTGRYPTSTGMTFNDIYLPSKEYCMAEIFADAGYQTAYLGKWHLDGHGRLNNVEAERRQGFQYWKALECSHDYNKMPYYANEDPEQRIWEGYSPDAIVNDAIGYLEDRQGKEEPFLLFLSLGTPHFPHHSAPEEYKKLYPLEEIRLAPNVPEELHEKVLPEIQGYYAHCTATDRAIGELLDHLEEQGQMENTILVFTSDHGEMMGSHGRLPFRKQLAWEESVRIPFLIRHPGMDGQEGAVLKAPLTTPDILPSLLGLCGIEIPSSIEGENLTELILHPDPDADRAAMIMNVTPFDVNWDDPPYKGIRTADYTYAVSPEGPLMLFDNSADPFQFTNLVNDPEHRDLQDRLHAELMKQLAGIGEEELHPRDYYIKKFGYRIERNNINYWSFYEGEGQVQSPGRVPGDFVSLFNGKNLEGWYPKIRSGDAALANKVFAVDKGMAHVFKDFPEEYELNTGGNATHGLFYTNEEYERYILRFEYKWGTGLANNFEQFQYDAGMYYHVVDDKIWPTGIEYQIRYDHTKDQNHTGDYWANQIRWYSTDSLSFTLPSEGGLPMPLKNGEHRCSADARANALNGQWNHCEVIVMGDEYSIHKLNGELVNMATELPIGKGRIGFQAETAEIFYRNIEIMEIEKSIPINEFLKDQV